MRMKRIVITGATSMIGVALTEECIRNGVEVCAVIRKDSYPIPPVFRMLSDDGDVEEHMMYNTFNMGLGMVLAVDKDDVDRTMDAIRAAGEDPYVVGQIEAGEKGVTLC